MSSRELKVPKVIRAPTLQGQRPGILPQQPIWPSATPASPPTKRRPRQGLQISARPDPLQVHINGTAISLQPLERAILRRLHADREKVVDILTLAQNTYGLRSITTTKVMGVVAKLRKTFEQHVLTGVQIERVLEPNGYRLIGVKSFSDDIE